MILYDRTTKKYVNENEYKKETLLFLYNTLIGRVLLKCIVARPFFSKLKAIYQHSKKSKKDIKPFIQKYNIDISYWDVNEFSCFNDFFIRKKKYKDNSKENDLVAIADSKLSYYEIDENLTLNIKNTTYTLSEILKNNNLANHYKNGICLVFRLSMDDYHRYVFLDNGTIKKKYKIKGLLHTIRPISKNHKVFCQNCREISVMNTSHFGLITQIEVGALLVGKINNHNKSNFLKLEEKGYFEYGGSTIVLLLENPIKIDEDIKEQSKKGIETIVKIGERIGQK